MARLEDFDELGRDYLLSMPMPAFETTPWAIPPAVANARIAIISTAGLQRRGDRPFSVDSSDFRLIPGDTPASALAMSHISTNFDRTGFQEDANVVLPLDRLRELAANGEIGSVASMHYSFMGATHPAKMQTTARHLAGLLKQDAIDIALLVPV
jgi:D-proline reductase (dithiol) PrdB